MNYFGNIGTGGSSSSSTGTSGSAASTGDKDDKKKRKPDLPIVAIKTTADYQRMKLERLMAKPDKPIIIPSRPKEKPLAPPPDFVRNIMGSSAGAGSGEFHVYRHIRRKEYARQRALVEQAKRDEHEQEFKKQLEERKRIADDKASKKRAKRLKKKIAKQKNRGKKPNNKSSSSSSSSEAEEEAEGVDEKSTKEDQDKSNEVSIKEDQDDKPKDEEVVTSSSNEPEIGPLENPDPGNKMNQESSPTVTSN